MIPHHSIDGVQAEEDRPDDGPDEFEDDGDTEGYLAEWHDEDE